MSLSIINSRAKLGLSSPLVSVEVHLSNGLPAFNIVGLPETAVKESKDRVRSAIINSKFELAVRHQATKSFGILKWNPSDNWQTATIEDVPSYMNVKIGDLIETSGASGLFPQGIVVGTVVKSEKIPATQFLKIKISLVEDYASVVSAYVVENKQLPELNRVKKLKHD